MTLVRSYEGSSGIGGAFVSAPAKDMPVFMTESANQFPIVRAVNVGSIEVGYSLVGERAARRGGKRNFSASRFPFLLGNNEDHPFTTSREPSDYVQHLGSGGKLIFTSTVDFRRSMARSHEQQSQNHEEKTAFHA